MLKREFVDYLAVLTGRFNLSYALLIFIELSCLKLKSQPVELNKQIK